MKAKKDHESSPDTVIDSTPKFNVVEVEFHHQDFTRTKRKIRIPHGRFSPPLVLRNGRDNQWFLWCKGVGIYQEVDGEILSEIEVINASI